MKAGKWRYIFVVAAIILIAGCNTNSANETPSGVDGISEATLSRYDTREIREYQGINLDPANGPRDNSIKGIQHVDIKDYTLSVTGLVDYPLKLTYEEVLAYPSFQRVVTLHCVEGWDATILWEGVKLVDLFKAAQTQGEANTVIFKCVDGYTTSLPFETIVERDLLLAYNANTAPLPPATGYPFIVVAEDKLGYKWARWVSEIELSSDDSYEGYWESNGYSNEAEVSDW